MYTLQVFPTKFTSMVKWMRVGLVTGLQRYRVVSWLNGVNLLLSHHREDRAVLAYPFQMVE